MLFSNLGAMKGGNFDNDNDNEGSFFKFHHDQQRQQQMYQSHPQFHLMDVTQEGECHSDDVQADSRSIAGDSLPVMHHSFPSDPNRPKKVDGGGSSGGGVGGDESGSIEVVKRPRGRPRGSKNKPKPVASVAPDTAGETSDDAPMRAYMVEIPGGRDVVDALTRFSRRHDLGISVLSGTGAVSNVTIRQSSAGGGSNLTFRGRFEIVSISATIFPPSFIATVTGGVSISIAGPQGQVVGGSVTGPLISAGTVIIVAAAFSKPSFHRLPMDEEQTVSSPGDGGKSTDVETHQHPQPPNRHLEQLFQQHRSIPGGSRTPSSLFGSAGMSPYGTHMAGDVIWAPTARAAPPPPPPY